MTEKTKKCKIKDTLQNDLLSFKKKSNEDNSNYE